MRELTKIRDVVAKRIEGAPHEVLLVLDATTGQNGIAQAKNFQQAIGVTGIILAKLDGTAKGGVVLAIKNQLNIPVKFVGLEVPARASYIRVIMSELTRCMSHLLWIGTHALDIGAHGVLVPRVDTPEMAMVAAAACRYPPEGDRGVNPIRA